MNVCVVGLGKLGCPMAAFFQSRGHSVVGVDSDPAVVDRAMLGGAPVEETGLQDLMDRFPFLVTGDLSTGLVAAEIIFVIVPTPSQNDGRFSTRLVHQALCEIAVEIAERNNIVIDRSAPVFTEKVVVPLVVLCSTVMPGDCESLITSMELAGELKCGKDFLFCYNPEFVALGDVLRNMAYPDFILIGESDSAAGEQLENFWKPIVAKMAIPVRRMNLVNAEIAKLALNNFVTLKISYANMLGELCELTPGADAHVVTQAIGHDRRIGHKALRPGLGYGGPCFPRDTKAFMVLLGDDVSGPYDQSTLPEATQAVNDRQTERVTVLVEKYLPPNGTVTILGRSYKSGTFVTEQSQGLQVERELRQIGITAIAIDPVGSVAELGTAGADVIVVALPDPRFSVIPCRENAVVIDCWGIVESTPGKLIKMGKHYVD